MGYYQWIALSSLEGWLRRGVVSSEAASKLTPKGDNAAPLTIAFVYMIIYRAPTTVVFVYFGCCTSIDKIGIHCIALLQNNILYNQLYKLM